MSSFEARLLQEYEAAAEANNPGVQAIADIDGAQADEDAEAAREKAQVAYDQSPVATVGPSRDDYDYDAAYAGGANLKAAGEGGGVKLPLKHFKPGFVGIGGYDQNGEKYRDTFADSDQHIQKAATALGQSSTNTVDGAPEDDVPHLSRAAYGMMQEGAGFEDFAASTSRNWNDVQKRKAWEIAKRSDEREWLQQRMQANDLDDPGYPAEIPEPGEAEPIYVKDLPGHQEWMSSAAIVYQAFKGQDPQGEDLNDWAMSRMSLFNNNMPAMVAMAVWAMHQEAPVAKAFMDMMVIWDNVDNWDPVVAKKMLFSLAMDPTTYIGMGVGSVAIKVTMRATKNVLLHNLMLLTASAGAGAVFGGGIEGARETVEIAGGARKEYDPAMIGAMSGVGGVVGAALPAGIMGAGKLVKGARKLVKKGKSP